MKTSNSSKPVLSFATQALDLPEAKVVIKRSRVEGPDRNDNLSVQVTFDLTNTGPIDWHRIDVNFMIFDSAGRIVADRREIFERRLAAGKACELSAGISSVEGHILHRGKDLCQGKRLAEDLENVHLVISTLAYTSEQQSLGEIELPDLADTPESFKFGQIDGVVSATGGMIWKSNPDEVDGMITIYTNVAMQNLCAQYLPSVWLVADIRDSIGLHLGSAGGADELYPGDLRLLSRYTRIDDDARAKGAIVSLALRAYRLVATGIAMHRGATHDPTAIRRGWGRSASSLVD